MLPLGSILPKRMRDSGLARGVVIAQILAEAQKWIEEKWGIEAAKKAIIRSLSHGELIIYTENLSFARELCLHEHELIEAINTKFKGKIITRLKFNSR